MNKYETIFILGADLTDEVRSNIVNKFLDYISEKGKITNHEEIGLKRLAYTLKKQNQGYYYLIEFESDPSDIYELERLYRITEEVLKFIVVRKDDDYE